MEPGEYKTSAEYTAIAKEPPLTAKAILGENGNLNFVYDRGRYVNGNMYTDNLGETTIINTYEVPLNSTSCTTYSLQTPWYEQRESITAVNIEDSFYNAKPTKTCHWFKGLQNVSSMSGLDNIDFSNVTDASYMFNETGYNATTWNIDLSSWDTSNVRSMSFMFNEAGRNATTWNIDGISDWNTSKLESTAVMFGYAGGKDTTWSIDLSKWDVKRLVSAERMFVNSGIAVETYDVNLSGWKFNDNLGSGKRMFDGMFAYAGNNSTVFTPNLSNWYIDTSHGCSMHSMMTLSAISANQYAPNLSGWVFHSDTNSSNANLEARAVFKDAGRGATYFTPNLSNWSIQNSNYVYFTDMFETSGIGSIYYKPNFENLTITDANIVQMDSMFESANNSTPHPSQGEFKMDLSGWTFENISRLTTNRMFYESGRYAKTWGIGDISNWNVRSAAEMTYMFFNAGAEAETWEYYGNLRQRWRFNSNPNLGNFINLNYYKSNQQSVLNAPRL